MGWGRRVGVGVSVTVLGSQMSHRSPPSKARLGGALATGGACHSSCGPSMRSPALLFAPHSIPSVPACACAVHGLPPNRNPLPSPIHP